jgi:hypothetical protein
MARFTQYPAATSPTDYTDATNFLIEAPDGTIKLASLEGLSTFFCSTQCTSLTVLSADILQLYSTPLTIVEAPGAGYAIEVLSASMTMAFNSIAYAGGYDLEIKTTGATNAQFSGEVLWMSLNGTKFLSLEEAFGPSQTQVIENAALTVTTNGSNPTTGNSNITVRVLYRIITV